ncbi:MAG: outer membrane protein assembly factor [Gemmatimonadota bacterium]
MTLRAGTARSFAIAFIVAAVGPTVLFAQAVRDPEVASLDFEGNEAFSDNDLATVLRSRQTTCTSVLLAPFCWFSDWGFAHSREYLDSLAVLDDELRIQLYYRDRGFFRATVDSRITRLDEKVRIDFTINEGEPTVIDSISINGVPAVLDSSEVLRLVDLAPGDRFDRVRLAVGKDSLVRSLRELGYIQTTVLEDLLRPPGEGARIKLSVDPGRRYRIGNITVVGAEEIGDGVIRELMRIGPGDVYRQSLIDNSQQILFGVDAVRFASIQPVVVDDSVVDLGVTITPKTTRAARGGFGWSTDRCLRTEARLTHRNLFGEAKRLEITARLDNIFAQQLGGAFPCNGVGSSPEFRSLNYLLRAELTVPVFLSGRNAFRTTLFGQRETFPDVFIREEVGAVVGISRAIRRGMSATIGYQPSYTGFDERSADIFFCVSFGFCTPEDIAVISQARWLSPIVLSWVNNRTNHQLQPTNGHYFTADFEWAANWTGSEYRYYRLTLQAADFETIEPGLIAGIRIRGGVVKPTGGPVSINPELDADLLHPAKRYFAGGSQSVRGFRQNLLGPRVLVADQLRDCPDEFLENCVGRIARETPRQFDERPQGGNASFELSLELRKRLTPTWTFVMFVDAGAIWEDLGKIKPPIWTPGAGIRFLSPVGPLRVDIGYNPTGAELLPVVVSLSNGSIVELPDPVLYDPFGFDDPSFITEFWRRLQFHISIGEAF